MSLVVYWLSLARMPSTILNYIRRYIFNFLWGSFLGNHKYHLVYWLTISNPYDLGGWTIKNLDWFSLALRTKSLWLVLNGDGLWSKIIKHKYLKNLPVDVWICQQSFTVKGTSHMWNGFIRPISWITICMGWKTRNGKNIKVGIDHIASLTSDFILLEDLKLYLKDYGILSLLDVLNRGVATTSIEYWLTTEELELGGQWKEAWT